MQQEQQQRNTMIRSLLHAHDIVLCIAEYLPTLYETMALILCSKSTATALLLPTNIEPSALDAASATAANKYLTNNLFKLLYLRKYCAETVARVEQTQERKLNNKRKLLQQEQQEQEQKQQKSTTTTSVTIEHPLFWYYLFTKTLHYHEAHVVKTRLIRYYEKDPISEVFVYQYSYEVPCLSLYKKRFNSFHYFEKYWKRVLEIYQQNDQSIETSWYTTPRPNRATSTRYYHVQDFLTSTNTSPVLPFCKQIERSGMHKYAYSTEKTIKQLLRRLLNVEPDKIWQLYNKNQHEQCHQLYTICRLELMPVTKMALKHFEKHGGEVSFHAMSWLLGNLWNHQWHMFLIHQYMMKASTANKIPKIVASWKMAVNCSRHKVKKHLNSSFEAVLK